MSRQREFPYGYQGRSQEIYKEIQIKLPDFPENLQPLKSLWMCPDQPLLNQMISERIKDEKERAESMSITRALQWAQAQ